VSKKTESEIFGESRAPVPRLNAAEMLHRDSPPDGLSWRDYLVQLLRIAASIEHALMVQYLFAAYSLDPQKGKKDTDHSAIISRWRRYPASPPNTSLFQFRATSAKLSSLIADRRS
jgi:hypothetical protein